MRQFFAREKSPDIRPFVVSSVVPDHVDNAFILIAGLNLGQQLHGTDASTVIGATKGVSKVSRFIAP